MKRTLFIIPALLTALLAGCILYVAFTEQGFRWILERAQNSVPGVLSVRDVSGRLIGPMSLNGIEYRSEEFTVAVDSLRLDWRPSSLSLLRVHIKEVSASGIRIKTKETEKTGQPWEGLPEITMPLRVILEKVQIRDISVSRQDTEPAFFLEEVLLTAILGRRSIHISRLNAKNPDVSLALQGGIKPQGDYPLNMQLQWDIRPEGYAEITGSGELDGTLKQLEIQQQTIDPFFSRVHATVYDLLQELRWEGNLSLSDLSLNKINSAWPEMEMTASVESTGSVSLFGVDGTVEIDEVGSGRFSLLKESDTWLLRMFKLTVPGTDAEVAISGSYTQVGDASSMQMKGRWNHLSWPLREVPTVAKSKEGTFEITGSLESFAFILNAAVTGSQIAQSSITLRGTGTQRGVDIQSFSAQLLDGELSGTASFSWNPSVSWQASLNAQSVNPGVRWPDWPGNLELEAHATGEMKGGKQRGYIEDAFVQGDLRGYPFKASAAFEMADDVYRLQRFELNSGSAYLTASGSYSHELEGEWNINIPEMGEILPDGSGELSGTGKINGNVEVPNILARIRGKGVSLGVFSAKIISADVDINTSKDAYSGFNIALENAYINAHSIKTASFIGDGTISSHTLSLHAAGEDGSLDLTADAGYEGEVWKGKTSYGELNLSGLGPWEMREEGTFSLSSGWAETGQWCVMQESASLCLQAIWRRSGVLSATADATGMPLALLNRYIPKEIEIEGIIGGSAEVEYGGRLNSGRIDLTVPEGILLYKEDEGETMKIPLSNAAFHGRITESGLDTDLDITLPGRGFVKGGITLPGADLLSIRKEHQGIAGEITAELNSLDMIPIFTERVRNTSGVLRADLKITGTSLQPVIRGDIDAEKVSAYIPDLGIKINDLKLKLTATQKGDADFYGQASSGDGKITFRGAFSTASGGYLPAHLHVEGDRFEAMKIPGTWLLVSPDISIGLKDKLVNFEGSVTIPEGSIEPHDISEAVTVSRDVTIIDGENGVERIEKWEVNSRIQLNLGERVNFRGFGLEGRMSGGLLIVEEPEKASRGQGELQIREGRYRAYGRELTIDNGRLVFSGLIDDPGLDIKAVRHMGDIESGVHVGGTLKSPELKVFSVPQMDDTDALSYLLFGRPMKQLSGSEGSQLYGAAVSAGLSGGGFLIKKISSAFGLEDVEIESGSSAEEASLVIGKYLSPRLYVSYGVGIFEPASTVRLRYYLSPKWLLQTEHGLESGGDVLYKIER